jgi:hypothetical protein
LDVWDRQNFNRHMQRFHLEFLCHFHHWDSFRLSLQSAKFRQKYENVFLPNCASLTMRRIMRFSLSDQRDLGRGMKLCIFEFWHHWYFGLSGGPLWSVTFREKYKIVLLSTLCKIYLIWIGSFNCYDRQNSDRHNNGLSNFRDRLCGPDLCLWWFWSMQFRHTQKSALL